GSPRSTSQASIAGRGTPERPGRGSRGGRAPVVGLGSSGQRWAGEVRVMSLLSSSFGRELSHGVRVRPAAGGLRRRVSLPSIRASADSTPDELGIAAEELDPGDAAPPCDLDLLELKKAVTRGQGKSVILAGDRSRLDGRVVPRRRVVLNRRGPRPSLPPRGGVPAHDVRAPPDEPSRSRPDDAARPRLEPP